MWISMTKPTTSEQEFEKFMAGQSGLSRIYQQTQADGPSELADRRILAAARDAVADQDGVKSHPKRWLIPAAIAAGLVVLSLVVLLHHQFGVQDQTDLAGQPPADREMLGNLKPDPAHLLGEIAQLVRDGKTAQARDQFRAFQELHPDYPLDFQAYPELEQFKQAK